MKLALSNSRKRGDFNCGESAMIKTVLRHGQNSRLCYHFDSIPAKPLVQTKLKRGGFFMLTTMTTR